MEHEPLLVIAGEREGALFSSWSAAAWRFQRPLSYGPWGPLCSSGNLTLADARSPLGTSPWLVMLSVLHAAEVSSAGCLGHENSPSSPSVYCRTVSRRGGCGIRARDESWGFTQREARQAVRTICRHGDICFLSKVFATLGSARGCCCSGASLFILYTAGPCSLELQKAEAAAEV